MTKGIMHTNWADSMAPDALALCIAKPSGGRLNKKDGLTRYGDSHVKDKMS